MRSRASCISLPRTIRPSSPARCGTSTAARTCSAGLSSVHGTAHALRPSARSSDNSVSSPRCRCASSRISPASQTPTCLRSSGACGRPPSRCSTGSRAHSGFRRHAVPAGGMAAPGEDPDTAVLDAIRADARLTSRQRTALTGGLRGVCRRNQRTSPSPPTGKREMTDRPLEGRPRSSPGPQAGSAEPSPRGSSRRE